MVFASLLPSSFVVGFISSAIFPSLLMGNPSKGTLRVRKGATIDRAGPAPLHSFRSTLFRYTLSLMAPTSYLNSASVAGRQAILIARQCRPSNHRVARLAPLHSFGRGTADALCYSLSARRYTLSARLAPLHSFCAASAALLAAARMCLGGPNWPRHSTDALCYSLSAAAAPLTHYVYSLSARRYTY
ncbi:hypothetical protein BHM03_00001018 [Ensete ventricosum]|nr:hypothetical protein BHM03_00001018 [Ensete ventricosum]